MCAKGWGDRMVGSNLFTFVTNHIYIYHIDAMRAKGLIPTARNSCQDGLNRMETKRMLLAPWHWLLFGIWDDIQQRSFMWTYSKQKEFLAHLRFMSTTWLRSPEMWAISRLCRLLVLQQRTLQSSQCCVVLCRQDASMVPKEFLQPLSCNQQAEATCSRDCPHPSTILTSLCLNEEMVRNQVLVGVDVAAVARWPVVFFATSRRRICCASPSNKFVQLGIRSCYFGWSFGNQADDWASESSGDDPAWWCRPRTGACGRNDADRTVIWR